jgi:hypothetical protein
LLHESGIVTGRQRAHIEAEEERVREFEIREFRIEHGVGENPFTILFVAAQNDSNILKILGAPVRSSTQAMILRRAVTIGGAARMVNPPGR